MMLRTLITLSLIVNTSLVAAEVKPGEITWQGTAYALYPAILDHPPDIPSPVTVGGTEVVVTTTASGRWALFAVTVANGEEYIYAKQAGKGRQLEVDGEDFPTLARTGLHSEIELDTVKTITGRSVSTITEIGRPEMSSGVGFMAADENIVSVLRGDNRIVRAMGLDHPGLARPLFHVWNSILAQLTAIRNHQGSWKDIVAIRYNGRTVGVDWVTTRGWQESIFDDEIYGGCQLTISRQLEPSEIAFLRRSYPGLDAAEMKQLAAALSGINIGEMGPYYVKRYGFYEGHTSFRAEPVAIALIFGLQSVEELEAAFPGQLPQVLTTHHTRQSMPVGRAS